MYNFEVLRGNWTCPKGKTFFFLLNNTIFVFPVPLGKVNKFVWAWNIIMFVFLHGPNLTKANKKKWGTRLSEVV